MKPYNIIIEGIDHCGKDTLIKCLQDSLGGQVHHSGKPPILEKYLNHNDIFSIVAKMSEEYYNYYGEFIDEEQVKEFTGYAAQYLYQENYFESMFHSADNLIGTVIYNRFHLGEYVYGKLYRNYTKYMAEMPFQIEKTIKYPNRFFLIHLAMHHPEIRVHDTDAFSMDRGYEESKLFLEAFNRSRLQKMLVYVDTIDGKWRRKEEIYEEVIDWLTDMVE